MAVRFSEFVAAKIKKAKSNAKVRVNETKSDATLKGAGGGSRLYLSIQRDLRNSVVEYGTEILEDLKPLDLSSTSVRSQDFDTAIQGIDKISEWARVEYQKHQSNAKPFGDQVPAFDETLLADVVSKAKFPLEEQKRSFLSGRSLFQRVISAATTRGIDWIIGAVGGFSLAALGQAINQIF